MNITYKTAIRIKAIKENSELTISLENLNEQVMPDFCEETCAKIMFALPRIVKSLYAFWLREQPSVTDNFCCEIGMRFTLLENKLGIDIASNEMIGHMLNRCIYLFLEKDEEFLRQFGFNKEEIM